MQTRFLVPALFAIAHTVSHASIEWPVLYATRAVEFTEHLVRECDVSFPNGTNGRRTALLAWKTRNEANSKVTRAYTFERLQKQDPKFDPAAVERDLDELERSALSQAVNAKGSWETMCSDMARWLTSEESDVERQIPDFMQAK